jgi:hypothetical protein
MVICHITSDAAAVRTGKGAAQRRHLGAQIELPVSAGQLVTTARVIVPVAARRFTDETTGIYSDPAGKTANYHCVLMGFSSKRTPGGWNQFTDNNTNASFGLSPTPSSITGNFVW